MAGMPEVATHQTLFAIAAGKTDVGRRRDHNEDQILINDELGLYAVADGMGGHQAGDVASSIAAASLEEFFWETEGDLEVEGNEEHHDGARRLAAGIHHCNHEVFARSGRSANQGGMGSTVVAIHVDPEEPLLHVAHVGDSRCYRIRDGAIEQLTRDHSMINEALRLNPDLSEEILKQLPSNVVTRALGTKEDVQPDIASEPILPGDTFLLCSDGLSGEVTDEDMLFSVLESDDVTEAAELLVTMANEAGGRDNISAIIVRIVDGSDMPTSGDELVIIDEDGEESVEVVEPLDDELDELDELDDELDELDESDESEVEQDYADLDEEELAALEEEAPPSEDDTTPFRRPPSLADLEPPFGSLSTVSAPGLASEVPPTDEDNPYATAVAVAREATADHFRSPARAIVELGDPLGAQPELSEPVRLCLACGHRLLPEERFCGMCGNSTDEEHDLPQCEACGSNIYPDTRFCVECGVRHGIDWY
jgi:PPM family protein phosphatase